MYAFNSAAIFSPGHPYIVKTSCVMAIGHRFLLSLLCCGFAVFRASHDIEHELHVKEDNNELLFAPKLLALRYSAVLGTWRQISHLSPHLRPSRRSRQPSAVPFCYWLLLLAGDVERNPGPVKFPCTMCSKPVKRNQRGIMCDSCDFWTHASCCDIGPDEYQQLSTCETSGWICPACLSSELPFATCSSVLDSFTDLSPPLDTSCLTSNEDHDTTLPPFTPSQLSFCHLNVQSLTTKFDEITDFLTNINTPLILGLSETWLDSSVSDANITPIEYKAYRKDRPNKRGGGIVVYVHDSLRSWRRQDL